MYYNTTNMEGRVLLKAVDRCQRQEEAIIAIFKQVSTSLSPWDIHGIFNQTVCKYANTPITSIRRAITNLEKEGRLIKTHEQKEGVYGRPEHLWRLPAPIAAQQSLFQ